MAKWAFLKPWVEVLRTNGAAERTRSTLPFDNPNVRVGATFYCYLSAGNDWHCEVNQRIRVTFSTNCEDHSHHQQVREAMELFTMLAAVDNAAFLIIMADMLFIFDHFSIDSGNSIIFPRWECQIVGSLSGQPTSQDLVTWGEFFMCPKDPRTYSTEFCLAMEKMEKMNLENRHWLRNEVIWIGRYDGVEFGGEQIIVDSTNKSEPPATAHQFSRELGKLFGLGTPPAAHLSASDDKSTLLEFWRQSRMLAKEPDSGVSGAYINVADFARRGVLEVVTALCSTDLSYLTVNFPDILDERAAIRREIACMITLLVSGQSLCAPINAVNTLSPFERLGYLTQLSLNFDCSTELFGGACAAFATSSSSSKLMLWVDCKEVEPLTVDHEYWAWLAYTFWSKASKCSVRDLTIRGIGLSCRGIAAFEATLQQNYPKAELDIVPTTSSHSCEYGYVNIQAGVQLNLMDNRNDDYVLLHACRCRAQYDSTTNSDVVEAIVPGYGMCTVALNEGRCEFLPDKSGVMVSTPNDLQSLKLDFAKVESEVILMNLLTHIGGNLRSLTLELNNETVYSANNRIASIDLSGVMNACPHLEEITFQNIQVYLSPYSELRNWNLKKLAMYDVDDDNSLNVCLRVLDDETLRTSRELVELDISLPRFGTRPYSTIQNHVAAMVTHDRKFLPVAKDKFPIESKAAMISVLSYNQPLEPSSVVHLLNPRILSLVFEYAATAEQRSVQITYLGRPVGVGLH